MKYTSIPASIKTGQLSKRKYSFSPASYKTLLFSSSEYTPLGQLIEENVKGFEPGSSEYINATDNFFLRISDMSDYDYVFAPSGSTKRIRPSAIPTDAQMVNKGDICYQTASNVGNICIYTDDKPAYFNSHIRKLRFKEDLTLYILAILKSQFAKEQVSSGGSIKGVDNFSTDALHDTLIPFPTTHNNPNPQAVVDYVSELMQDLLSKEEIVQKKLLEIDTVITGELENNQKPKSFIFHPPTAHEVFMQGRFDAGIYSERYKRMEFTVTNYKHGHYYLQSDNVTPGQTPKDYYFSDSKKSDKFYEWITPRNIDGRVKQFRTYIHTNSVSKVKKNSIIVNGIRYVGNGIFNDQDITYANQNTLIINEHADQTDQLFLLCYLTSPLAKAMQMTQRNFGLVPILYSENLCKIPVPTMPKHIKENVAKLYYNNSASNSEKGVHQLNSEILSLREKLETTIDSIVNNRYIDTAN